MQSGIPELQWGMVAGWGSRRQVYRAPAGHPLRPLLPQGQEMRGEGQAAWCQH